MARRTERPPRKPAGFTLIEILAVIFLTALVLTVAVDFYIDLSEASNVAAERTRVARRATSQLDRVARDLEGATLVVKPAEMDPLEHPWLFLAEEENELGAERIKFVTRSHLPRSAEGHEADLAVVTYELRDGLDQDFALYRGSSTRLPPALDRSFPEEEDALLLAEGLAGFGVQLLTEDGGFKNTWDSSTLDDSSQLPLGALIQVTMLDEAGEALGPFSRSVRIPVRPIDLEALLAGEEEGEDQEDEEDEETAEGDEDCVTVAQCVAANQQLIRSFGVDPSVVTDLVEKRGQECYAQSGLPAVPGCD
jgi:prepilin-type N-terminal cleavage/methylation domain-containing protein